MPAPRVPLPVDDVIAEILRLLDGQASLVLQAAPASGKTTRVPPALANAAWRLSDRQILVLEPRRLAAKLAAQRVAEERGESVGGSVGYQFRFERALSENTRLTFLTEGMLMRRLLADPSLRNAAAVVLDEFHERHLHGDVALAYLRHLQRTSRPDLKIVVMSATLDSDAVAAFLGGCSIVRADGRRFEVAVEYLSRPPAQPLETLVAHSVGRLLSPPGAHSGDILVFLPGMAEIKRAQNALANSHPHAIVAPLHGELSRDEQEFALRRADRTKVILSTNVAESSLTIEGVTAVIDSGLERSAGYSFWTGVPTLKTKPISRASAEQRAGRAGRTQPGRCLRLYTQWDFDSRAAFATPEIQRADLARTVLELKALGIPDVQSFGWFEQPSLSAVGAAEQLLARLGALDADGRLTTVGRRMSNHAAHPRLAKLMIEAAERGAASPAATLATLLQEDRLEGLDALSEAERELPRDFYLQKIRRQFLDFVKDKEPRTAAGSVDEGLRWAVWSAFPDRVARKSKTNKPGNTRKVSLLLATGGSATAADEPVTRANDTFVILDVQERDGFSHAKSELRVRSLVPVREDLLLNASSALLVEREEMLWDRERESVAAVSRLYYGELVLIESRQEPKDFPAAARLLAKEGFHLQPERFSSMSLPEFLTHAAALPGAGHLEATAARLEILHRYSPELGVAEITADSLGALVLRALEGCLSVADARRLDVARHVLNTLPPAVRTRLDAWLPESVTLTGGRKVNIHYELGRGPWIESRLQDFFGMDQGPSLMDGRLPLTLHLLAPNRRPVQLTTDLAGFWLRTYAQVRRELSRRYPRHPWPEDPLKS